MVQTVSFNLLEPRSADFYTAITKVTYFISGLTGESPRKPLPAGPSRTPEQLTADYLSLLIKHLRYILGQKLGAAVLRSVSLELVLTVPAIWNPSTREKTLEACRKARIDIKTSVSLVSEPVSAKMLLRTTLQSEVDSGSCCNIHPERLGLT